MRLRAGNHRDGAIRAPGRGPKKQSPARSAEVSSTPRLLTRPDSSRFTLTIEFTAMTAITTAVTVQTTAPKIPQTA